MPIDTLDGLEQGTQVVIVSGAGRRTRWTVADGGLTNETLATVGASPLEPWFFTGALAEGSVYLRDTAPPEPGDWFLGEDGHEYLVLEVEGEDATCLMTYSMNTVKIGGIVDTMGRSTVPEWAGGVVAGKLLVLGQRVVRAERRATRADMVEARVNRALRSIRVVRDYAATSIDALEAINE